MNDAQGSARFYQALDMPSMRRCVSAQWNHPPPTLGFYSLHWIFSSTLTGRLFLYYTLLHLRKYTTIFCRSRIISDLLVFTPVCVCVFCFLHKTNDDDADKPTCLIICMSIIFLIVFPMQSECVNCSLRIFRHTCFSKTD